MTLDELNAFIDERDEIYRAWKDGSTTQRERILARTVKLMEEVGEAANEVLSSLGHQRKEKLARHTSEKLAEELADVIITTLLVAKAVDADIPVALEKKMLEINKRDSHPSEENHY